VLQTARDEFRVRYVPQAVSPPSAGCLDALEQCLASLLDGRISLEPTDLLMPESSGKFRLVYPS